MSIVNGRTKGVVAAMLVVVLAAAQSARAQATIHLMQGKVDVSISTTGTPEWVAATQGASLPSGSLIRTEQGSAVIYLPDGTAVALWPKTMLDFRQMEFNADMKALNLTAVVWMGRLQFNLTPSPNTESSYVLRTPNGQVTLVRAEGNIWYARETGTRVVLTKGQATVTAAGRSVSLMSSQETTIAPGGAPKPPAFIGGIAPPFVAPPPQTGAPGGQPPRTTPAVRLSDMEKRKQVIKERLMGITSVVPDEILSAEQLDLQIEQLEKAVSQKPDDFSAHSRLAALYTQRKRATSARHPISDIDAAVIHYQIVARAEQGKAESHVHLGEAYARSGEAEKAIEEFNAALRISPQLAQAREWLAFVYAAMDRFDEAEREYKAAIDLDRADPLFRANYAGFLSERKRLPEAIEQMQQAIKLVENTPFAALSVEFQSGLAWMYLENKQEEEAIGLLRNLTDQLPQEAELHVFLGLALLRKGAKDEAKLSFEKASRNARNAPLVHFGLASLYEADGDKVKAANELEQFLNNIPPGFVTPPGFPSIADIRDHMRELRGLEPLQKERGRGSSAA
jgi:Tfp pilus assembly protein PilF